MAWTTSCYWGPIEVVNPEGYMYGDSAIPEFDCPADADQYPLQTTLLKSETDLTHFSVSIGTAEVGTSKVMDVTTPSEIVTAPDTFTVAIGSAAHCKVENVTTEDFTGLRADRVHVADYNDPAGCTFEGYKHHTDAFDYLDYEIMVCDANGDHPGTPSPPPPSGTAYAGSSTGSFPGPVWFQVLQSSEDEVCAVVRYQSPGGPVRSGLILAEAVTVETGHERYTVSGSAFMNGLSTGVVDVVETAPGTVTVTGTTGVQAIDERFQLTGPHVLAAVPGPGPVYLTGVEAYLNSVCQELMEQ
ncbi:MAG: hypothetical protein GY871_06965 [Actinomycetales bacterium]|nr:hypothetical protein [Actinomycetales bacterium]